MGIYISFGHLLHIIFKSTITPAAAKLAVQSRQSRNKSTFPFMGAAKRLNILPSRRHFSILALQILGIQCGGKHSLIKAEAFEILWFFYLAFGASWSQDQLTPSASHADSGHFLPRPVVLFYPDRLLPLVLTLFGFSISSRDTTKSSLI